MNILKTIQLGDVVTFIPLRCRWHNGKKVTRKINSTTGWVTVRFGGYKNFILNANDILEIKRDGKIIYQT